jgi:hypothetical protein
MYRRLDLEWNRHPLSIRYLDLMLDRQPTVEPPLHQPLVVERKLLRLPRLVQLVGQLSTARKQLDQRRLESLVHGHTLLADDDLSSERPHPRGGVGAQAKPCVEVRVRDELRLAEVASTVRRAKLVRCVSMRRLVKASVPACVDGALDHSPLVGDELVRRQRELDQSPVGDRASVGCRELGLSRPLQSLCDGLQLLLVVRFRQLDSRSHLERLQYQLRHGPLVLLRLQPRHVRAEHQPEALGVLAVDGLVVGEQPAEEPAVLGAVVSSSEEPTEVDAEQAVLPAEQDEPVALDAMVELGVLAAEPVVLAVEPAAQVALEEPDVSAELGVLAVVSELMVRYSSAVATDVVVGDVLLHRALLVRVVPAQLAVEHRAAGVVGPLGLDLVAGGVGRRLAFALQPDVVALPLGAADRVVDLADAVDPLVVVHRLAAAVLGAVALAELLAARGLGVRHLVAHRLAAEHPVGVVPHELAVLARAAVAALVGRHRPDLHELSAGRPPPL